ncbi:MAG: endonuclease/exonuclease/phosphatase family protein [Candidatus Roizmanbacteria bacterium]|nr:endonuclease/exonuclease/phosphatase family protein [Candidatus Roizmanbacteria bacterium]
MKLKILSWNIWLNGNLNTISTFLEHSNADIIGLQEVIVANKTIELAKHFTEHLGYKHVFARSFDNEIDGVQVKVGNAIFSKFPIVDSKIHHLSNEINRVALQADIKINSSIIHVFNTHLIHTHQNPSELQNLQATHLAKVLPLKKTILMGDFNALPNSNPINIVSRVLENTDKNMLPTWSIYPKGCRVCSPQGVLYKLDNIFTSSDIKSSDFMVEKSKASDHLPISATIEIN